MIFKPKILPTHFRHVLLFGATFTSPLWFATPQVLAAGLTITSVTTSTTDGAANNNVQAAGASSLGTGDFSSTTTYTLNFQGDTKRVTGFSTSGGTATIGTAADVIIRRSGSDQGQNVWYEGSRSGNTLTLNATGPVTLEQVLESNNIFAGADSVLTNTGTVSPYSIERIDFILPSSFAASSSTGFAVLDRSGDTTHDDFRIAAITGYNTSNSTVSSFGNLVAPNSGWGNASLDPPTATMYRLNNSGTSGTGAPRNPADAREDPPGQYIGGVFFRTDELVAANTTIYGYSIFASDVIAPNASTTDSCTSLTAVASNACYPTNTNVSIDPVASNFGRISYSTNAVPEPSTILGSGVAIGFGALLKMQYSRRQQSQLMSRKQNLLAQVEPQDDRET